MNDHCKMVRLCVFDALLVCVIVYEVIRPNVMKVISVLNNSINTLSETTSHLDISWNCFGSLCRRLCVKYLISVHKLKKIIHVVLSYSQMSRH